MKWRLNMHKYLLAFKLIRYGIEMKLCNFLRIKSSKRIHENYYNIITKFSELGVDEFVCMNYGFASDNELKLNPLDEAERYPLQLYDYVATGAGTLSLTDLDVLEVGSGRGGGASYIARYYKPKKIIGMDLSSYATQFCMQNYKDIHNLDFINGDAEAIPFSDSSLDAVINVESSHCYPNFENFVEEVNRILKPGGYFLFTDFRSTPEVDIFDKTFEKTGFQKLYEQDISRSVIDSLTADTKHRLEIIKKIKMPWFIRMPIKDFAGCVNSNTYNAYAKGKRKYMYYVLQKPA